MAMAVEPFLRSDIQQLVPESSDAERRLRRYHRYVEGIKVPCGVIFLGMRTLFEG